MLLVQGCITTLSAAHAVDARMNDVLIADQQHEISHLRERVARLTKERDSLRRSLRIPTAHVASTDRDTAESSAPESTESEYECISALLGDDSAAPFEVDPENQPPHIVRTHGRRSVSLRSARRRKRFEALQQTKQSLLHSYERKHSTTIESVVRRTSRLALTTQSSPDTHSTIPSSSDATNVSERE